MRLAIVMFMALTLSLVTGCAPELREDYRVQSPDGLLDAVIVTRQTDATVPTPIEVYVLLAKGVPSGDPVWRADNISKLHVEWTKERSLNIRAYEARVFLKRDSVEVVMGADSGKAQVVIASDVKHAL